MVTRVSGGPRPGKHTTPATKIEQAIARGWTPQRIFTELGVTYAEYRTARARINETGTP